MDPRQGELTTRVTVIHGGARWVLEPGMSLTFGRNTGPGGAPPSQRHLELGDDRSLHAHAGTVRAAHDGCTLANTGRWLHLRLQHVGGPDRADLAPGRSLRVPWLRNRVEVVTGQSTVGFALVVEGPDLGDSDASALGGDTVAALDLDRSSGYFRALVALCEPRLRDPASDEVAAASRIALRLGRLEVEPNRVTVKAVERRLAHARRRIGLGGDDPYGVSAAGLEVRDAARQLVDLALRTGTVTVADLALLEPGEPR